MMMDSENYYKSLSEKELRILIKDDNDDALDEFIRRCNTGEIKRRLYTIEQIEKATKMLEGKSRRTA